MRKVRVGLLGCGLVGTGVVEVLAETSERWAALGVEIALSRIAVRDLNRPRSPLVRREWLTANWREVSAAGDVDVVLEAMGGVEPAFEAVRTALAHGKTVITANKELLAAHGVALRAVARGHGAVLLNEATVLGGVPVIHLLDTYFKINRIRALRGIVNGTCNHVLTRMDETGCSLEEALSEAKAKGYAEPDPTYDLSGWDARAKLKILIEHTLGIAVPVDRIPCTGIAHVSPLDIAAVRALGGKLRLVAEARTAEGGALMAGVGPQVVFPGDPLYAVDGVDNALMVSAAALKRALGAAGFATAVYPLAVPAAGLPAVRSEPTRVSTM
ncbi:hypothetical protein GCM10010885_08850 [Alicyclobacillus cellulosilyticus]|uniref:Homoserine dehydrogenase n=1 Tax=Alicyclobacillus cellulosilyticus TaxID=1003997 RepID=A0A917NHV3_9BACL|nr:homoserine dehydrogenase [Alicyclobacillus cellulosilyticus]GGJ01885.1 hypothetical protein GCM10010885_08850 [Alicyclobacillus cellulosilyticus]